MSMRDARRYGNGRHLTVRKTIPALQEAASRYEEALEELDAVLVSFESLKEEISLELEDISDSLDLIQDCFTECGAVFRKHGIAGKSSCSNGEELDVDENHAI